MADGLRFMSHLPIVADRGKMPLLRYAIAIGRERGNLYVEFIVNRNAR